MRQSSSVIARMSSSPQLVEEFPLTMTDLYRSFFAILTVFFEQIY